MSRLLPIRPILIIALLLAIAVVAHSGGVDHHGVAGGDGGSGSKTPVDGGSPFPIANGGSPFSRSNRNNSTGGLNKSDASSYSVSPSSVKLICLLAYASFS
ncbi:unnamed protein product [Lactuca virosa]|uniref:Uncharacterized protein n=1 Tax=Lactuca virosa TaxID=75947 RepID=A0AAU9M6Q3_9ASTR|nr:unnamed protein product [Lactuca virosa]